MGRCNLLNALFLSGSVVAWAQAAQPTPLTGEAAQKKPATLCLQPPPLVRWQDYNGPLAKTVGVFARKLERKAVQPPHYKPGSSLQQGPYVWARRLGLRQAIRSEFRQSNRGPFLWRFSLSNDLFRGSPLLSNGARQHKSTAVSRHESHRCGAARQWKIHVQFQPVARHGKFGGAQQSVPSRQPARRGRGDAKRRLYVTSGHGIRRAARVLAGGSS